jgi:hypothetical protein
MCEKGGWHVMGRFIVLCLIILSFLCIPGNSCALDITGELWQNAFASAQNPASGPPKIIVDGKEVEAPATAKFTVSQMNFDSMRVQEPGSISYNDFLKPVSWDIPLGSTFNPSLPMFSGTSPQADQGIFFRFTMSLFIPDGPLPITVVHDDGFSFSIIVNLFEFNEASHPVYGPDPVSTTFFVKGIDEGTYYPVTLNYGALNDSVDHVLIYSTPEPWTILLLGIGVLGIGIVRRMN